jgi:hypothetical protein
MNFMGMHPLLACPGNPFGQTDIKLIIFHGNINIISFGKKYPWEMGFPGEGGPADRPGYGTKKGGLWDI